MVRRISRKPRCAFLRRREWRDASLFASLRISSRMIFMSDLSRLDRRIRDSASSRNSRPAFFVRMAIWRSTKSCTASNKRARPSRRRSACSVSPPSFIWRIRASNSSKPMASIMRRENMPCWVNSLAFSSPAAVAACCIAACMAALSLFSSISAKDCGCPSPACASPACGSPLAPSCDCPSPEFCSADLSSSAVSSVSGCSCSDAIAGGVSSGRRK